MNLMERLTISRHNRIGDETQVKSVAEINFNDEDEQYFLRLDGKPTHRFAQCTNSDPQNIAELDSNVIVLMPLSPWCALCRNKKVPLEDSGMFQLNGETVSSALVLESAPFHGKKQLTDVLEGMVKKINLHMKKLVETIEKNCDRGR